MEKNQAIHVPYTSQLFEEDEQIVAVCPELNVSSFDDTPQLALAALQEAVAVHFKIVATCVGGARPSLRGGAAAEAIQLVSRGRDCFAAQSAARNDGSPLN